MDDQIRFGYFTGKESEMLTFYRVPKLLITSDYFEKVSNDAKMLYGLMLDRMSLSAKNGWIDAESRVYIYFSIEDTMSLLRIGRNKAVKIMSELDEKTGIGLIERKRPGQGKPALIYVKNFWKGDGKSGSEVYISNFKKSQNQTSGSPESKLLEVPNGDPNKNNINNTESSKTSYLIRSVDVDKTPQTDVAGYSELIKDNIDYPSLLQRYPYEQDNVEEIYELILETVLSQKDRIYIARDSYPAELVRSRFLKLRYDHVEYVLESMKKNTTRVCNIKKYLLAALFNAPATIGNYYQAEVNYDMMHPVV